MKNGVEDSLRECLGNRISGTGTDPWDWKGNIIVTVVLYIMFFFPHTHFLKEKIISQWRDIHLTDTEWAITVLNNKSTTGRRGPSDGEFSQPWQHPANHSLFVLVMLSRRLSFQSLEMSQTFRVDDTTHSHHNSTWSITLTQCHSWWKALRHFINVISLVQFWFIVDYRLNISKD